MPRQINEDRTRKGMIDPQLEKAGWYLRDHSKVKIEIHVDGYDAEPWNGVSDYCLCRENGEALTQEFEFNTTEYKYNVDQIRFLRVMQSVFSQKRHLETANLYEPPLEMFGADAVERWYTKQEVGDIVAFASKLQI